MVESGNHLNFLAAAQLSLLHQLSNKMKIHNLGVYEFIYQLSSAIDGILDISIRTAGAAQRDPPKSEPAF